MKYLLTYLHSNVAINITHIYIIAVILELESIKYSKIQENENKYQIWLSSLGI